MLYKPTYCCNCGDKIERAEWRIWDSRRFCQLCETEHKAGDLIPRVIVGLGIVLGVFGFGSFFKEGSGRPAADTRERISVRSLKPAVPSSTDRDSANSDSTTVTLSESGNVRDRTSETGAGYDETAPERKQQTNIGGVSSHGEVFYCGAPTKKGTPCSRRVKKKGRCWQHGGST